MNFSWIFIFQPRVRVSGNFTKEYELTRRDSHRFYHEAWQSLNKDLKSERFHEIYIENWVRMVRMREGDGFDKTRFELSKGDIHKPRGQKEGRGI